MRSIDATSQATSVTDPMIIQLSRDSTSPRTAASAPAYAARPMAQEISNTSTVRTH